MKYHLWKIGCQYNEWDAGRLCFLMQQSGFEESGPEDADVIIILACSVRQTAVDRMLGKINNWTRNKLKNPSTSLRVSLRTEERTNKTILITGCVLDSDKKKFGEKGLKFFETGDFEALKKLLKNSGFRIKSGMTDNCIISRFPTKSGITGTINSKKLQANKLRSCAYVPIMSGCNNFCSYCVVPYTRGREKSWPMEEIIKDVKIIINRKTPTPSGRSSDHSVGEIMLLGQNVNSYRIKNNESRIINHGDTKTDNRSLITDNRDKSDFTILLEALNNLEGDFKISFVSSHPKDMSDDIIEAVSKLPKIKKEIHLPLQSGSDKILKAMNRPYTVEQYLKLVEKLTTYDLRLTTDIIVGFPGETERDFQKTVDLFKKVKFDKAYINKYSPRAGTAAYKLGDPIPWTEKQRRWQIINDLIKCNT